jgi:hypothetical protein
MLRRSLLCSCALVVALLLARPAAGQVPAPAVQSGWKVEVRRPGTAAWNTATTATSMGTARKAAVDLYGTGLQVRITRYTSLTFLRPNGGSAAPPAIVPPAAPAQPLPQFPPAVTWPQAVGLFDQMAGMGDRIAFRFPTDGCYARAHIMAQEMRKLGHQPWKVWSKANGNEQLYARTSNHPRGFVTWGWHVAPILRVKLSSGKVLWCVIDPSLFKKPATITQWKLAQKRPGAQVDPLLEITPLGRAPLYKGKREGTGFSVADTIPAQRLDEAAAARMAEYKPFQGKWHPKLDKDAPAWVKATLPPNSGTPTVKAPTAPSTGKSIVDEILQSTRPAPKPPAPLFGIPRSRAAG